MFCWNCGSKIPDKSKFCMNCGAKIEYESGDNSPIEETARPNQMELTAIQEPQPPVQFTIQGIKLEFPSSIQEYTRRRKDFADTIEPFIHQQKEEVSNSLSSLASDNIDKCVEIITAFGIEVSNKLIDTVHQNLMHEKIYTISREQIATLYNNAAQSFAKEYDSFYEKYLEIIGDIEQLKQARELKRAHRSYWQGGGFGLRGALVGAAKAGVLNAGTGLVRGIGDTLTDAGDRNKAYKKKLALLQSKDWSRNFEMALLEDMYQIYDVYATLLADHGKLLIPNLDESLSNTYFKNGKSCTQPEEQIALFVKALQCYPYAGGVYVALGKTIGYTNIEVLSMYDYFLAFHQVRGYVKLLFSIQYFPKAKSISGDSYKDLDKRIALVDQQLSVIADMRNVSKSFAEACDPYEQAFRTTREELVYKRLTSDDGKHFQSIDDLNLYLRERDQYKKYRQETLTRIVPFERQTELLAQAEACNFQNPYTRSDMAQWKTELTNCSKAKNTYSKSFEEYFFLYWRVKNSDKITTELPLSVQTMLTKTPYISIVRFINVQLAKIKPSSIFGPTIEAWFFASDFYIGMAIPTQSEIHILQTQNLAFINVNPEKGTLTFVKKDSTCETIKFLLPDNPNETDMKLDIEFGEWIDAINGALANARKRQNDNLCPVCGQPLFKGAAFCGGCGYKL